MLTLSPSSPQSSHTVARDVTSSNLIFVLPKSWVVSSNQFIYLEEINCEKDFSFFLNLEKGMNKMALYMNTLDQKILQRILLTS